MGRGQEVRRGWGPQGLLAPGMHEGPVRCLGLLPSQQAGHVWQSHSYPANCFSNLAPQARPANQDARAAALEEADELMARKLQAKEDAAQAMGVGAVQRAGGLGSVPSGTHAAFASSFAFIPVVPLCRELCLRCCDLLWLPEPCSTEALNPCCPLVHPCTQAGRGAGGRGGAPKGETYIRISEEEIADDYPLPKQYEKGERIRLWRAGLVCLVLLLGLLCADQGWVVSSWPWDPSAAAQWPPIGSLAVALDTELCVAAPRPPPLRRG